MVEKIRYDPPRIAQGLHEGTPYWTKQAAKRQHLLFLEVKSPRHGLGSPKVKSESRIAGRSRTPLFQKLIVEILQEQLCAQTCSPIKKS